MNLTLLNRPLLAAACAAVVMFVAGACGSIGPGTSTGCTTDAECGTQKMCHPTLKSCVTSCTGSADCPSSAKTCATLSGAPGGGDAGVQAFCQCSTDALCNGSGATGQVCQDTTSKVCTSKCTSNSDCGTGSTCDTATGKCGTGSTDAGTDAGTTDAGTDAGMPVDAGVTCNSTNPEPDVCGYGNVCNSANTCDAIVDGTCANISARTPFNRATSTGPIIYNVIDETADDSSKCAAGAPNAFTVTVYAYAGTLDFPTNKNNLPGFFYYAANGNTTDIPANLLQSTGYTISNNNKNIAATFTLCGSSTTTTLPAAFGFTNGNGFCKTLTR